MHARGGKLDGNMASQTPCGIPPKRSGKKVSEGSIGAAKQPGVGQYPTAPWGVCFACGRSGHYKKWCPNKKQGEAVAESGDQGAAVPQGGAPVLEWPRRQAEDNVIERISSHTRSRTGARSEAGTGTSSGVRDGSLSDGRFTTGQHSVLAAGEEEGRSGTHGWRVDMPIPIKKGLRAGHGYEV